MTACRRDESGAIMLCGLFFCVLSVSMVHYLWGIAELIRYREQVQDAADGAAFSAAVVHAHGMNLLAFLNMLMAALLAILVALRLAQLLVWVAIGIIVAVGWMSGGALYSAITPLQQVSNKIDNVADNMEGRIHDLIEVVHKVGEVVVRVTPAAAMARAVQVSRAGYKDVHLAVAIPDGLTLPVENDDFGVLCERATGYAAGMAMMPLPLPSKVKGGVSNALEGLAEAGSGWFCGEQGADPPSLSRGGQENVPLPVSEARQRCMASLDSGKDADAEACVEAALFELGSLPDQRGECRRGRPACPHECASDPLSCPPGGEECAGAFAEPEQLARARRPIDDCEPLEWRFAQARVQCRPSSAGGEKNLRAMAWIEEPLVRTFRFDGTAWHMVDEQSPEDARLVQQDIDSKKVPCGPFGEVGDGFSETGDVCESEGECLGPAGSCNRVGRRAGDTFRERVVVVRELVQCVQRRKVPKKERQKQAKETNVRPEGDDDSLTPFKVEEGLWLGDDEFQLLAFSLGSHPNPLPAEGVRAAAWGQGDGPSVLGKAARVLEDFGLAQGEYAFRDGSDTLVSTKQRGGMLWKMGWHARLRPLRLPGGSFCGSGGGRQGKGGKRAQSKLDTGQLDACKTLDGALSKKPWEKRR